MTQAFCLDFLYDNWRYKCKPGCCPKVKNTHNTSVNQSRLYSPCSAIVTVRFLFLLLLMWPQSFSLHLKHASCVLSSDVTLLLCDKLFNINTLPEDVWHQWSRPLTAEHNAASSVFGGYCHQVSPPPSFLYKLFLVSSVQMFLCCCFSTFQDKYHKLLCNKMLKKTNALSPLALSLDALITWP